ncbi:hypothetical protein [Vibrio sp.]|uniref:hypothetical protein n=1 Tax=Vibrio sp. TaxID=678 RepID=UPI003D102296
MKQAVILIADTHINSKTGLCGPNVIDDDGDIHRQNLIQEWLWYTWNKCLNDIKRLTKKYYRTVIFNGDIVDLDAKKRSNQMISRNPATILRMADQVVSPLIEFADRSFFVRGTEAHVGRSGWIEEMMAERYSAEPNKDFGQFSWWHLRAVFSGVKFDVAHHNSLGGLPYTYPNNMNRLVQMTRLAYLDWEEPVPDVVVRGHMHRFVDTGYTFSTRGVSLPCWQFHNAYLYRIRKENDMPHIGAVVVICDDGEKELIPLLYKPKRSPAWKRM